MNRSIAAALILVLWFSLPGMSNAADLADVQIHGFVGQGYLLSSGNNYLGDTEKGSFDFSEIGLNFAVPLTDNLRFGAQLFSRNIGDFGENSVIFDWAFLDYDWRDWLGFRAGKIKQPMGMYNRQREVDMLRTFVLLPQSVYAESAREIMMSFYGVDIYGTWEIGKLGYLDYELFVGTLGTPDHGEIPVDGVSQSPQPGFPDMDQVDIDIENIVGGMLFWNTPLPGFRVGGSLLLGDMNLSIPSPFDPDSTLTMEIINNGIYILSAEYEIKNLTLAAEYFGLKLNGQIQGMSIMDILVGGWYASASWNVVDWLALGSYYMAYYPNLHDKDGSGQAEDGVPDYYAWQKEIVASAKFNINEYWCVKFETHFINGVGLVPQANNSGIMEEDWILYAIKTSLNF